ncbi:MAG TPA: hypothetical protein VNT30_18035 [Stellaceae bacterium]|nr:hypothetical protein [Stellaceae bacterium]
MSVTIHRCAACGHSCFPARQLCHRCGGAEWTPVTVDRGTVEELTTVLHQADAAVAGTVHLASVRTDSGVVILARLDRAVALGAEVGLTLSPTGAVHGT